ncbi:hypothetical protein EGW08_016231 [Elysia chlorotica]|uniref:Endonuclease/exonuclease/phosphatase domain-containing protein n=1 Tax=Elysia chlorotica TaxID=188477 RepID=A0A433T377_ELYCH|nr:hypothetical protein EGW08_016231 [Elysia chlorotica]
MLSQTEEPEKRPVLRMSKFAPEAVSREQARLAKRLLAPLTVDKVKAECDAATACFVWSKEKIQEVYDFRSSRGSNATKTGYYEDIAQWCAGGAGDRSVVSRPQTDLKSRSSGHRLSDLKSRASGHRLFDRKSRASGQCLSPTEVSESGKVSLSEGDAPHNKTEIREVKEEDVRWGSQRTHDIAMATEDIDRNMDRNVMNRLGASDHKPMIIGLDKSSAPATN